MIKKALNAQRGDAGFDFLGALIGIVIIISVVISIARAIMGPTNDYEAYMDNVTQKTDPSEILKYAQKSLKDNERANIVDDYITASQGSRESIIKAFEMGELTTLNRDHIKTKISEAFSQKEIMRLNACYSGTTLIACKNALDDLSVQEQEKYEQGIELDQGPFDPYQKNRQDNSVQK